MPQRYWKKLATVVDSPPPFTFTWPHLRCDVGLEEGEYRENCLSCSDLYYYNGAQRYEQ